MLSLRKNAAVYLMLLLSVSVVLIIGNRVSNTVDYKNTAHIFMLTTMQQWEKNGMLHYHAAPVQTFSKPGDKFNAYYDRLLDSDGNNYYISHPPGAFVFNYTVFIITGLNPSQSILQLISMIWLISGAWLLYFITVMLIGGNSKYTPVAGLFAAVIYLFHPVNLYAFSFHNFAETFGQYLFLLSVFAWLRYKKTPNLLNTVLLTVSLAFFVYTDWLAIPFVFVLIWLKRKEILRKQAKKLILILALSFGIPLLLTAVQYISLSGINAFIRALGIRYLERSGFFGATYTDMGYDVTNPESYELLWKQLINLFSGSGLIALVLLMSSFFFKDRKKYFPAILIFPPLLFAIGLFSATITHYIYIAKFTPFIACASALILQQHLQKSSLLLSRVLIALALGSFIVSIYFTYNRYQQQMPYEASLQKHLDNQAAKFAVASPDARCHYLLSKNEEPRYIIYLSFVAQRNIRVLRDQHEKDSVQTLPETFVAE